MSDHARELTVTSQRALSVDDTMRLLAQLNTGDVILLSGDGLFSWGVKYMTGSEWSHVAVVLRHKSHPNPLMWHSTSHATNDVRGWSKSGVVPTDLLETIRLHYTGRIGIRKLAAPLTDAQLRVVNDTFAELDGREYETGLAGAWELVKAWERRFTQPNVKNLTHIFCSELVAELYIRLGFLTETLDKPSNEYTQAEFATLHCNGSTCENHLQELAILPLRNPRFENS